MAFMSETRQPTPPPWIHDPTEEPLSPNLRAAVIKELKKDLHFYKIQDFRRNLKAAWIDEGSHQTIKDANGRLGLKYFNRYTNKLTVFYWIPLPQVDGSPIPMTPFGCIDKAWNRYHNGRPPVEAREVFTHLVRVYPTGPTEIQEVVTLHKQFCQDALSLLAPFLQSGEPNHSNGRPPRDPQSYNINPTYHGIIIMMDQYIKPTFDRSRGDIIDLDEQAQKLTVLLVRTGDDTHLCAPINFEQLRTSGVCLPLGRSDISDPSNDVVRVSLATAVTFICDLNQREVNARPPIKAIQKYEQRLQEYADEIMKQADAKGIDNVSETWTAVRRVKAARKGEIFEPKEPYVLGRFFR